MSRLRSLPRVLASAVALGAVLTAVLPPMPLAAAERHAKHGKHRGGPGHVFPVDFGARVSPLAARHAVRAAGTGGTRSLEPGFPELDIAVRPGVTPKAARIYTLGLRVGF